jgi:hypothetical protein
MLRLELLQISLLSLLDQSLTESSASMILDVEGNGHSNEPSVRSPLGKSWTVSLYHVIYEAVPYCLDFTIPANRMSGIINTSNRRL